MRAVLIILLASVMAQAEPLSNLVSVNDGLSSTESSGTLDDYIRLHLITPGYSEITRINSAIHNWLGPDMTFMLNTEQILVQAPRDPSRRVTFIAALLALDIK